MDTQTNTSRRHLMKTAMAMAGSAVLLTACGKKSAEQTATNTPKTVKNENPNADRYDCFGSHQAGIRTPHQLFGNLTTFDLTITDKNRLIDYFRILTARIEFLTQGGEIKDTDPRLPPEASGLLGKNLPSDGLTITVSVGDSLFDNRFGLSDKKPLRLKEMKRFPNDKLNADWCDGDISIQFCAHSPETCQNALRDIIKNTAKFAVPRWSLDGWLPKAEPGAMAARNLFGYRDGSGNPDISDDKVANEVLWTGVAANSLDEPAWAKNGSYQAVRLIRQFVEFWDRTPLQEQNTIFGREKYSGAPLGQKHESDTPNYTGNCESDKGNCDGNSIPLDSHMRLGNPRNAGWERHRILRRPFNYSLGLAKNKQLDVGLLMIIYQANLDDGFIFVQNAMNGEPLEEYIRPFGGGYFFTLPGFQKGEFLGQGMFEI
ncbi:MAG: deferrochelatase/peroxidase EfeB [Neisseriaceae bacterium]|nr:deferrochelatase/peroxidase EfeB [Neisseriaceae bacterium]